jgi:DNA-directed RNA polymerase sigma subunit (sigma70/sigma32)
MTKRTEPIPFFGLVEVDDDEPVDRDLYSRTQQDIADELGVTRNAVGDVERRAIKKFKEVFLSKFNKDDFI